MQAMVKRATYFAILLQDDLKSNVARFITDQTCLATNQAVASCVNTDV